MPDIGSFDNENDWMGACVPAMVDEGKEQDQAVAACLTMWREKDKNTKAGRRLRGEWLARLKEMKAAFTGWLKALGDMESWADYADAPPDEDEAEEEDEETDNEAGKKPRKAFYTFKARDGSTWLLTWTTNAFRDRDGELFTTKSIEEYVTRHEGEATKGEFQLWHMPGTKFGTIRWQGVVGRFLAEAGPFDSTPMGERFKAFFEAHPDGHEAHAPSGWATSHGFSYRPGDRDDGVYDWFDKAETSVLPFEAAANQHNPRPEVLSMNDKQKALLKEIGGDELVNTVIATGEARTKELEEQGIAYKAEGATEQPAPEAEKSEPEQVAPAIDYKAIEDHFHMGELSEAFTVLEAGVAGLAGAVKALQAQMEKIAKADEERIAEKMAGVPRFAWHRASQAAATVLSDSQADATLKAKKPTPSAIAGIAAKIGGQ